jgi:hypothetical protein
MDDIFIVHFYFRTLPVKFQNLNKNLVFFKKEFSYKFHITMTKKRRRYSTMSNNIFNSQQNQSVGSGYYPYSYPAAMGAPMRPEIPNYMIPPVAPSAYLKGRLVSSFEEARAAQVDLDGSLFVFPDIGNKKIYTKKINLDGTVP